MASLFFVSLSLSSSCVSFVYGPGTQKKKRSLQAGPGRQTVFSDFYFHLFVVPRVLYLFLIELVFNLCSGRVAVPTQL